MVGRERLYFSQIITVEESKSMDTYLNVVEGMQFDRGYLSSYMANDPEKMETVLENPYILIVDKKITHIKLFFMLGQVVCKKQYICKFYYFRGLKGGDT